MELESKCDGDQLSDLLSTEPTMSSLWTRPWPDFMGFNFAGSNYLWYPQALAQSVLA